MDLVCKVQNYEWGTRGPQGLVAKIAASGGLVNNNSIAENSPFAEFWMGTHPNGPAKLLDSDVTLKHWLEANQDALGDDEKAQFGNDLPFLFKVLAVAEPLSIQAHPEKKHAEELHRLKPDLYKDPNHKPEMVIAWSEAFEALCGFRPEEEIRRFFNEVPSLQTLAGVPGLPGPSDGDFSQILKASFSRSMNCSQEDVKREISAHLDIIKERNNDVAHQLFVRIAALYPDDVGCFCVYFMNYVILKRGEVMFLGPNIPHAYIFGECLECMACSDNVVRAGLTPKFKDVETLCTMLDYQTGPVERFKLNWMKENEYSSLCAPPVPDFSVAQIKVGPNEEYETIARRSASILLVMQGSAKIDALPKGFGTVLFLRSNQTCRLIAEESLVVFQAFSNPQ
uniref:mannose-6-phosphate isomerase n=1 Tax=Lynceus sp. MCZ IZ 141354 TaxID=1930659 RepID=A0A9N6WT36_9CRUS|nr:EOG090X07LH [Lynceus sp. MCZ IZ 141354]